MSQGFSLSPNLQHLETSATIAVSAEAKRRKAAGEDVIDLGAGEPDFLTPGIPSDAGIKAIKEGKHHYPANEGILEVRAAAAKHLSLLSGGRPVNADHVVVSNGSKQSLFNACFTLFGPGDVVAIPAPAWVSYPQIVHLARARPVLVSGDPEWSLKVGVRDLERMLPAPKGLILCSPSNPTGAVYPPDQVAALEPHRARLTSASFPVRGRRRNSASRWSAAERSGSSFTDSMIFFNASTWATRSASPGLTAMSGLIPTPSQLVLVTGFTARPVETNTMK